MQPVSYRFRLFGGPPAFFGAAALGLSLPIACGVLGAALLAGAIRIAPVLLAPGVPARVAWPLVRGALGMSLEAAVLAAPSLAWALAASRLVERGEARALHLLGAGPLRIVASTWPALVVVAAAAAISAAAWGREAAAPGSLIRALLAEARRSCVDSAAVPAADGGAPYATAEVPVIAVSWICFRGQPPRAVAAFPGGERSGGFAAESFDPSDDLRSFRLRALSAVVPIGSARLAREVSRPGDVPRPGEDDAAERVRITAGEVHAVSVPPVARGSNLGAAFRAALVALTACALAAAASLAVLAVGARSRVVAGALGLAGAAAALMTFSALERMPRAPHDYAAVPVAGVAAVAAAAAIARRLAPLP